MSDPASRLPARPSLEQLRKQARELLRALRSGDPAALERVRAVIHRTGDPGPSLALAGAQFVIARELGFPGWAELARHVQSVNPTPGRSAPLIRPIEMRKGISVTLSDGDVVSSGDVYGIFVAARAGDVKGVRRLVTRHPALATHAYNYTPPIHFAVREGHVELTRFFLDRGADPTYTTYPFGDSLLTMALDRDHHEIAAIVRARVAERFGDPLDITATLTAARTGDVERIRSALARDRRIATQGDGTGNTALHEAARHGHLELVRMLLDAGARVDATRGDGQRAVHCAIMPEWRAQVSPEHARAITDLFLERGARYTMFIAAMRNDESFIRDALARDASLANAEDTCHRRPLSAAAARQDLAMVKLLLAHGADPRLPEAGAPGGLALWHAVYRRHYDMARMLLEHGADPNAMVESSGTPMGHARKDPALFDLLSRYGGRQETNDEAQLGRLIDDRDLAGVEAILRRRPELAKNDQLFWNEGILCGPASVPDREMILLLMRHGARVPAVTKWAPYYYFKHLEGARLLLEQGMDPNHMNWHGTTLLHHFAAQGDVARVRLLLDYGAVLDGVDEEYRSTPLGMSARFGRREVMALLLERGADTGLGGAAWSTPLAWARKKGHAEIEDALRRAGATT